MNSTLCVRRTGAMSFSIQSVHIELPEFATVFDNYYDVLHCVCSVCLHPWVLKVTAVLSRVTSVYNFCQNSEQLSPIVADDKCG